MQKLKNKSKIFSWHTRYQSKQDFPNSVKGDKSMRICGRYLLNLNLCLNLTLLRCGRRWFMFGTTLSDVPYVRSMLLPVFVSPLYHSRALLYTACKVHVASSVCFSALSFHSSPIYRM